jgi:hypothetical protein
MTPVVSLARRFVGGAPPPTIKRRARINIPAR